MSTEHDCKPVLLALLQWPAQAAWGHPFGCLRTSRLASTTEVLPKRTAKLHRILECCAGGYCVTQGGVAV